MDIEPFLTEPPVLIDLADLGGEPGPYCMSFGFDLKALIESIKRFGLLNIPCVTKGAKGQVDIVTGYRRLLACKSLGRHHVPARDLSRAGMSALNCLLLNLSDNLTTRELNEVEKGMFLRRLSTLAQKKEILTRYMPRLALPKNEMVLETYLRIEELDHEIKTSLARGELSLQTVRRLQEMDQDSQTTAFEWLSIMNLNMNQQKQFIDNTIDLANKERVSICSLLGEKDLQAIRHDKRLNLPQKAKRLLEHLRARRLPRLSQAEKGFQRTVSELRLPPGVRVFHPPYFEGSTYRLEVLFETGQMLRRKIGLLSQLEGLENIGDPWQRNHGASADDSKTPD
jgi:ParB-like chromosome segregation protein Spo0J